MSMASLNVQRIVRSVGGIFKQVPHFLIVNELLLDVGFDR